MNEIIPPFNFQEVIVEPWTILGSEHIWVVLMGFLVTATCGSIGVYLILRRMALVGDAISHSVLPGLAVAFLAASFVAGSGAAAGGQMVEAAATGVHHNFRNPTLMFFGALAAGILTTLLIEVIHKKSRVKQDAAIGITFSSLFAIGVILISVFADKVDLDADCVLYGEIGQVAPFFSPMVEVGGVGIGTWPVVRMGAVALLTGLVIIFFYKELLVSSFDSGLAASLGINPTFVHYALMCWLSVVVVSSFEAVGAILVVAMLILPGATASLLSHRMGSIFLIVILHSALSAITGLHLGYWLNVPIAGAMVVMGVFFFTLAWMFSPSQGLLTRWLRLRANSAGTQPAPQTGS
jgi:manganese/zinc/iron transport system permease protein